MEVLYSFLRGLCLLGAGSFWSLAATPQSGGVFRIGMDEGYMEGSAIELKASEADPGVDYHWLKGQRLQVTQGGYGERVLHGRIRFFAASGQLLADGHCRKGARHGEWREWHPSGRLRSIQHWHKGRRSGWTSVFDAKGDLQCRERYVRGSLKTQRTVGGEQADRVHARRKVKTDVLIGDPVIAGPGEEQNAAVEKQRKSVKKERPQRASRVGNRGEDSPKERRVEKERRKKGGKSEGRRERLRSKGRKPGLEPPVKP